MNEKKERKREYNNWEREKLRTIKSYKNDETETETERNRETETEW